MKQPPTTIQAYRYSVVVDTARTLNCAQASAESIVHIIAVRHAHQCSTADIAHHLATRFGTHHPANSTHFVQSVIKQITTPRGTQPPPSQMDTTSP